ncbi:MAG: hypothetical protein IKZ45_04660 [Fibrobacter sp.]|nr:hypothetical protein [Fibrobacter sp.]
MKRLVVLLLIMSSFSISEQLTFFVQVPSSRNWMMGNPFLVENNDGIRHQMQDAGGDGWFSYSWETDSMPEEILVYSAKDSMLVDPLTPNSASAIYIKIIFEAFGRDSLFYISDDFCWLDEETDGFYIQDVRGESCRGDYNKADLSKTLYVLVPDYREWIDEIPVVVDARDSNYRREMYPDKDGNPGWFYYKWNDDEWAPENILVYAKSDSTLERPIGLMGFAYGETDIRPISWNGTLYFAPDYHYDCFEPRNQVGFPLLKSCPQVKSSKIYTSIYRSGSFDIRSNCSLRKDCLKDDFEPFYYHFIYGKDLYYSVCKKDGEIIQTNKSLSSDTNDVVFVKDETALAHAKSTLPKADDISFNVRNMDDGDYVVVFFEFSEYGLGLTAAKEYDFVVENGRVGLRSNQSVMEKVFNSWVLVKDRNIVVRNERKTRYQIFSSLGQIVGQGIVQGSINIPLPASGVYLVKVGSEIHRINAK